MNMKALGSILVLQWMVLEIIITLKARGHRDRFSFLFSTPALKQAKGSATENNQKFLHN